VKTIYVGGTFDLFHWGHVEFLRKAKTIAGQYGKVVVSVNRDEFVERYKGRRPLFDLNERIRVLRGCKYVDEVVINIGDEDSALALAGVSPDVILHGDDWMNDSYLEQLGVTEDWLAERKIRVRYVAYTEGVSSSEVLSRVRDLYGNCHCSCKREGAQVDPGQSPLSDSPSDGDACLCQ
jgi:glycerol-3-phosphate cytidylyltransferase